MERAERARSGDTMEGDRFGVQRFPRGPFVSSAAVAMRPWSLRAVESSKQTEALEAKAACPVSHPPPRQWVGKSSERCKNGDPGCLDTIGRTDGGRGDGSAAGSQITITTLLLLLEAWRWEVLRQPGTRRIG